MKRERFPCGITGCPALAESGSRWCAVHRAMSPAERGDEQRQGERREFKAPNLRPVTTRVEYEGDK